ncbi:AAA family ATPase, partial [Mycobacterium avium]
RPLAPVAAAAAAGMALPSREQLLGFIGELDRPGRLTLVEGAGGLLVELGENGVTARDLAVALGAAVLVVVRPALG